MKRNTLNGIIIIDSEEFKDSRGSFSENFNLKKFRKISKKRKINFVQDNLSISIISKILSLELFIKKIFSDSKSELVKTSL